MAILNYTTKINPARSVAEIQQLLGSRGAKSIAVDYDDSGKPTALVFILRVADSECRFRLPRNAQGVLKALRASKIARTMQTEEHAECVSWRILKDWIEAQLALIEAGQAQMAEVFLPYAVAPNGQTMFQRFVESNTKQFCAVNE